MNFKLSSKLDDSDPFSKGIPYKKMRKARRLCAF